MYFYTLPQSDIDAIIEPHEGKAYADDVSNHKPNKKYTQQHVFFRALHFHSKYSRLLGCIH